eukprot:SAG25_NODE_1330_length_3278_cov_1.534130_2_plen_149_part_00
MMVIAVPPEDMEAAAMDTFTNKELTTAVDKWRELDLCSPRCVLRLCCRAFLSSADKRPLQQYCYPPGGHQAGGGDATACTVASVEAAMVQASHECCLTSSVRIIACRRSTGADRAKCAATACRAVCRATLKTYVRSISDSCSRNLRGA